MTESTSPEVGRAAIDAYLDSVEQALLAARAPRGDRVQVLQDLESQIADMLASGPQPVTDEIVQWTLAKLEPPSHFAAMYGNGSGGKEARAEVGSDEAPHRSFMRWPLVAAASCACLAFGCILVLLANMSSGHPDDAYSFVAFVLLVVGFVVTPLALWRAVKQLRTQPGDGREREMVAKTALVYCVAVPVLVVGVFALATEGIIFIPFGVAVFVYLNFMLVRRVNRHLNETLPPAEGGVSGRAATQAGPAVGGTISMPAV